MTRLQSTDILPKDERFENLAAKRIIDFFVLSLWIKSRVRFVIIGDKDTQHGPIWHGIVMLSMHLVSIIKDFPTSHSDIFNRGSSANQKGDLDFRDISVGEIGAADGCP